VSKKPVRDGQERAVPGRAMATQEPSFTNQIFRSEAPTRFPVDVARRAHLSLRCGWNPGTLAKVSGSAGFYLF